MTDSAPLSPASTLVREVARRRTFAIISHPDADHYAGFSPIFEVPTLKFGTIYHDGIVERVAASATKGLAAMIQVPTGVRSARRFSRSRKGLPMACRPRLRSRNAR